MSDVDDIQEPVDDESDDENLDDVEPTPEDLAEAAELPPEPAGGDVESIQDILAKQEAQSDDDDEGDDEEEAVATVTMTRDEPAEAVDSRVVPMQATEFQCRNCYLVKHRSQLADRKKMLCRDCA